jgi:hypothetical protein
LERFLYGVEKVALNNNSSEKENSDEKNPGKIASDEQRATNMRSVAMVGLMFRADAASPFAERRLHAWEVAVFDYIYGGDYNSDLLDVQVHGFTVFTRLYIRTRIFLTNTDLFSFFTCSGFFPESSSQFSREPGFLNPDPDRYRIRLSL